MTTNSPCELLLPVGNMKMCLAAIHNGADAIYVGVPEFNARGRSVDHSITDLKEIIETCHLYGVKVNLAFNVVIFEDELFEVVKLLKEVLPLHPDAIIVQDLGLLKIIRKMAPHQAIHASTQMTITNYESMILLDDLKIKRFVLGREVSILEMKQIREKTDIELEVFVHGALCVAYSGQCFTSESIGGRSANRGQCAQSCRFEYELIVDGVKKQLVDEKYLVSPHDLCGISQIPSLIDLKINSFKVEGRLKTPEYVAAAGKQYRMAIDRHLHHKNLSQKEIENAKHEMGLTFSRGFFSGWLNGVDHQALVSGKYSSHRGNLIGSVSKVSANSVKIKTSYKFKNGDGLLIASVNLENKIELGGKIIKLNGVDEVEIFFHKGFEYKKVKNGFEVYLNSDQEITNKLTKSYEDKNFKKRIPISITVEAVINAQLKVTIVDDQNNTSIIFSENSILKSLTNPATKESIGDELGALSATVYRLNKLKLIADEPFFIHQKELKTIRRKFCEQLNILRIEKADLPILDYEFNDIANANNKSESSDYKLNVMLREYDQVEHLVSFIDEIKSVLGIVYLDYEFGKDFMPSVKLLKDCGVKVGIATTRILKPAEYYNFKIIERATPDVILIRNLGALQYFQDKNFELRGDFSLNVSNSITANYLLDKKLKTVCASYDLNFERLIKLINHSNPKSIEVTIHQYMPSFHMEHCVFAAFMSNGHTFRDCGKPCEKHSVEIKDQFGNFHFIKADQECRNTMYNAIPQSAGRKISKLKDAGLLEFRFEALSENKELLKEKILAYSKIILSQSDDELESLINLIGTSEKYGLGEGTLGKSREYVDRKKS